MRSNEERITQLHKRVAELNHQRQKKILTACTAFCSILCVTLIGMIVSLSQPAAGYTGAEYTGATLIDGSVAGGYVLTALIAFVLGVMLTVLIRKYREVNGK
ncbi:MAG: hypothetical protein J5367_06140 [Lachnospiraceae bacterium]|nr:hypothetical protein [Lachnospiraceae bacterium]